jgi:hypothetical protein
MDNERLKNPPGPGRVEYFDEVLRRIRDLRDSGRRYCQKALDIDATSVDDVPDAALSRQLLATVWGKMDGRHTGTRRPKWFMNEPTRTGPSWGC